jgi:hypothetical protein
MTALPSSTSESRPSSSQHPTVVLDGQRQTNQKLWSTPVSSAVSTSLSSPLNAIKSLAEIAIYECGTEAGLHALRDLAKLCQQRKPFDFSKHNNSDRLISHLPNLFPESDRVKFLQVVRFMESNDWLSQNPDSVDGLPSLHINLVSQAKPLFPVEETKRDNEKDSFEDGIQRLYNIVQPYVYDELLPRVKAELSSKEGTPPSDINLRVSDVFLRRYGQDICGGDRNGISAHYDVFAKVTAVIALDDAAADGRNGLYTTVVDKETGETSNHKAMRRFFPLRDGDAAVHTWDVLHGVDVEPGLDRTSLIVWFDEFPESDDGGTDKGVTPWLTSHPDWKQDTKNDVLQFVLASAISSVEEPKLPSYLPSSVELYLQSAARRNTFAMTRMGSLCEEGALADSAMREKALELLENLRPRAIIPSILLQLFGKNRQQELAMRFWLEGAIDGSPLAQKALADELMIISLQSGNVDGRLLAAVLFALAAQQDDQGAWESLSRVIALDISGRGVDREEAVVQAANAAIVA